MFLSQFINIATQALNNCLHFTKSVMSRTEVQMTLVHLLSKLPCLQQIQKESMREIAEKTCSLVMQMSNIQLL